MADKLAAFNEHADDVIKMVGVDCFNERFTESTSTVSMRDWVARLTDRANDLVSQQSARLHPKHVANFDPNPDAHSGAGGSGVRPTTPTFQQLEGGSGDGNDGLDLGQEAPARSLRDPVVEEEEAVCHPKPHRRDRSSSSTRGSPPAPPKKPVSKKASSSPDKPKA
ncbi:hypothetical protein C8R47DRAFT_1125561 [Mycena vitilis]|nr:hypothetical protein C8R47DRAFT_1125561 [Mycena vitilis]